MQLQAWEWEGGHRASSESGGTSVQRLNNGVGETIQKDCCVIFEGIRRLIEGTCCLQGEENLCVWDLFYKLHEAFSEHVDFEERWILPRLQEPERSHHRSEHLRLRSLIEDARWEFEAAEGDRFREILRNLANELKAHHEDDPQLEVLEGTPGLLRDQNFLRIVERAEQGVLS